MTKTSRAAIVDAAVQLIRERGFAGMSMQELADRVGLLKGSLYSHFPSKAALVPEVLAKVEAELLQPEEDGDWLGNYERNVRALAQHLIQNDKCLGFQLLYGLAEKDGELRKSVGAFFRNIESRLTANLARGMEQETAEYLARDTLTWIEGCTLWTALDGDPIPMRSALEALIARAETYGQPIEAPTVRDLLDRTMGDWRRASQAERRLAERVVTLEADYTNIQAAFAGHVEAESCFR
ncbi:TetR/AcrR family transcriptional regulator [Sphingomonas sp. SORGH_AS_0879]|uniref:TetR/AcrR family transcriptional regulator n=1 Tax=Sphingomonas sp. SORGH_AS_0879 TaxID=3041790 RepID=UPI00277D33A5|nr:TetR/AcrR family transcriptional regulator [Sphingomonas sp. SORGH_AS_0879]MDQ1229709.1 TetR/AcrR family transcriptional repressor of nem operon [Sphingomonas sp. SORGH_AS_0879]